jgi:integrase
MPRTLEKLSAVAVAKHTDPGRLSDGGGLYLNVAPSGSKSWLFMWNVGKKRFEMGLGGYPAITLKAARSKAAECRTVVAEGRNPIAERQKEKATTFGDAAEAFIASMEKSWRNEKHRDQWRQTLGVEVKGVKRKTSYCASLRDKPVAEITTEDVLEIIEPIWTAKSETASRIRGRIEQVLDYAKVKKWRDGENPARWRGHLKHSLAPRKKLAARGHHPAMAYKEVPVFMGALRQREAMAARALEFLILTAARSGEVLGAEWGEIDFDNGVWTVPKGRMKGGEEHAVPLSSAAVDLLRPLYENRVSDYVFPGNVTVKRKGKSVNPRLSSMAMEMLLRRMGIENVTVHGFRSSFRDWCGDETDFPREVAEAALAHKLKSDVERAYRRSKALEKRRLLMEAWATYCSGKEPVSNVVSLRA